MPKYNVTGGKRCIYGLRPFTGRGFFILQERTCHAKAWKCLPI